MAGRLEGKVALITGAARGMGAAEARLFVAEGSRVVIADVLVNEGKALARELGAAACFVELDVTDETAWEQTVDQATATFGGLDVLVNNAGVASLSPLVATTVEDYMRVVGVNQLGVFLGMRAVTPAMNRAGRGSIVNISSIDGLAGTPMAVAYVASKFAVRGMTKVAALELAGANIRVNSIHPGGVRTAMIDLVPGLDLGALVEPSIPMKRLGRPEEIAQLALFLASDESSYCTGSEFVADGGVTAGVLIDAATPAASEEMASSRERPILRGA
jgi:3alpha(or 20beta)-hydroxysteroid dehydrogenase